MSEGQYWSLPVCLVSERCHTAAVWMLSLYLYTKSYLRAFMPCILEPAVLCVFSFIKTD